TAFTTCVRTDGVFKFVAVGHSRSPDDYLSSLREAVGTSVRRVLSEDTKVESLVIHLPKDFGKAEREQVELGLVDGQKGGTMACDVLKITDEHRFFVVDNEHPSGVPNRGTCTRLRSTEYLLYTEGRDEKLSWMGRAPSALRIRRYKDSAASPLLTEDL